MCQGRLWYLNQDTWNQDDAVEGPRARRPKAHIRIDYSTKEVQALARMYLPPTARRDLHHQQPLAGEAQGHVTPARTLLYRAHKGV